MCGSFVNKGASCQTSYMSFSYWIVQHGLTRLGIQNLAVAICCVSVIGKLQRYAN